MEIKREAIESKTEIIIMVKPATNLMETYFASGVVLDEMLTVWAKDKSHIIEELIDKCGSFDQFVAQAVKDNIITELYRWTHLYGVI